MKTTILHWFIIISLVKIAKSDKWWEFGEERTFYAGGRVGLTIPEINFITQQFCSEWHIPGKLTQVYKGTMYGAVWGSGLGDSLSSHAKEIKK